MKFLFVLAAVLATTQALSLDTEWELFKLKYQRNYLSSDEVRTSHFGIEKLMSVN